MLMAAARIARGACSPKKAEIPFEASREQDISTAQSEWRSDECVRISGIVFKKIPEGGGAQSSPLKMRYVSPFARGV